MPQNDEHFQIAPDASPQDVLAVVHELLEELYDRQAVRVLKYAREQIPYLTEEDMWQPHDYPELDQNPRFQYEDGQRTAIRAVQISIRSRLANQFRKDEW